MSEQPETIKVRAIDVHPYRWALWCAIEDGEPFANDICSRTWSDDGEYIWFMLESHNALRARPDDILELVPVDPMYVSDELIIDAWKRDIEKMKKRPVRCISCGHTRPAQEGGEGNG